MMSVISSGDLSTSLRIQYRITLKIPLVKNDAKSLEGIEGYSSIADDKTNQMLAFVMGKISLRRIPNMSLTDINKA